MLYGNICRYDVECAIARIHSMAYDVEKMRLQCESERLLLSFYDVRLPSSSPPAMHSVEHHIPSERLLQDHSAWLLSRYIPANIYGDGNCLFRSVSYALFGNQMHHALLRLLAVIEVLTNCYLYDQCNPQFYAPFQADVWVQLPEYQKFITELSRSNSYCDLLAVLATSSVVNKAIQTL